MPACGRPPRNTPAAPNILDKGTGLGGSDIIELGVSHAACLATNRIMVAGAPTKFAQRAPDRLGLHDSGWRFFAADEDDVYKDKVSNLGVYAINTVANYDQVITPILDEAPGTAWVRAGDTPIPGPQGFAETRD